MRIVLPWPKENLWPNRKPHWAVKARDTRLARSTTRWLCREAGIRKGRVLTFDFRPPRQPGRMNIDNVIAALKPYIDGIADALGVDDSELVLMFPEAFSEPVKGGAVLVTVEPVEGAA